MFRLIDTIISEFRTCFKRERTWKWFACMVVGFMIRREQRGVTSTVSALRLNPVHYYTMLHFFRSKAYVVRDIYRKWVGIALQRRTTLEVNGRLVLLGDHIKICKEGRRMPCVQKHHQESQNSGKPEYIEGHNYGQISAVMTNGETVRSIPLMTEMQESKAKTGGESLVAQMLILAADAAKAAGKAAIVVLDAYFCSGVAWETADRFKDGDGRKMVEIVTRAKRSTVAYTEPAKQGERKRGRPRLYGDKIKLSSLFSSARGLFSENEFLLYGKKSKVLYLCKDLIWKPAGGMVRFVLVEIEKKPFILMSSDLTLRPEEIIGLYEKRFKIETGFDEIKNGMGGFGYRFWTKALPKRKRGRDTELPTGKNALDRVLGARQAIEMHVCLNCIATGILTIIAFRHSRDIWNRYPGWLRTVRNPVPTISTTKTVLSQDFYSLSPSLHHLNTFNFITSIQRSVEFLYRYA